MKEQIRAWLNEKIVKGFYKAHSWLLNMAAFLVAVLPDIINYGISNVDTLVGSIPTLSVEHKLHLLMAVNVLSLILKAYKQRNGPIAVAEHEAADATGTEFFKSGVMGAAGDGSVSVTVHNHAGDGANIDIVREIERHMESQIKNGDSGVSTAIRRRFGVDSIAKEDGPEARMPTRNRSDDESVDRPGYDK